MSRRSTSASEDIDESQPLTKEGQTAAAAHKTRMLMISFVLLVVIGLGNKVFQKLETIPMYNYVRYMGYYDLFL
jgi:hypothetical protein